MGVSSLTAENIDITANKLIMSIVTLPGITLDGTNMESHPTQTMIVEGMNVYNDKKLMLY